MVAAAKLLAPGSEKLFQSVGLSRRTVSDRITDLAEDIEKTLKHTAGNFELFSLACDETTDITNTAQLAIFLRGITTEFETQEELLSLEAMHGTTRGEDLYEKLVLSMERFGLKFEKLSGLTTDGAPAMAGSQKGLVAFVKKELNRLNLDPNDLVACHCIIHQQSLCAQSLQFNNVMSIVVSCVNFIKSKGFNNRLFKDFLNELCSEYGDLVYHCEQFMEAKDKPVRELCDSKWLRDLAFMVDITKYLSELNVKLQGPNQLLSSLLSNVKSFEAKLRLWKLQLEKGNTVHFPTLEAQKPSTALEYAGECAKPLEALSERFNDLKSRQVELNIFAIPFNVEPADVPDNLQNEIIQLQSDDELKARYNNLRLLEFYKRYISNDEFPALRRHALKYASVFGTNYLCEQFFSKVTIAKSRPRSRLTDANLVNQLRVATSSIRANIPRLTREKQFQPSH
ncbi:hypothetical protein D918_09394 [Trichuris suis]|nr:hypothetical protein D918_09394 [Trichuris suis]